MTSPHTAMPQTRAAASALPRGNGALPEIAGSALSARRAQREWAAKPVSMRISAVRALRCLIAEEPEKWARAAGGARQRPAAESLSAEVLPLLEACRFLERRAEKILAPNRLGTRGRPLWLGGVDARIFREPFGLVLVIGPGNYPLFLPGVQTAQALAAGNAVLLKPGVDGSEAARLLRDSLVRCGLDGNLLAVLPEARSAVYAAMEVGVDKIIFTGSCDAGRAVLAAAAEKLVPATAELSGCDAVFVRADADFAMAARALEFGLRLNAGETCIAPRRVFAPADFCEMYAPRFPGLAFSAAGSDDEAVERARNCPFALGAAIFSRDENAARKMAARLDAGVVLINDLIVPTADPRIPFGGRKRSGFGVTRGAEGLLEMTAPKTVLARGGGWRPHFEEPQAGDVEIFRHYIRASHGKTLSMRLRALRGLLALLRKRHGKSR